MKTVLEGYMGSKSHGIYIGEQADDVDIMRIVLPDPNDFLGLKQPFEVKHKQDGELDLVTYSLHKYMRLILKGNPNVISLLWLNRDHYVFIGAIGELLIRERHRFMGAKPIFDAFCGYAYSQLKRMTAYKTEGYMGKKRKAVVWAYGYDTKNAAHLIRLLRMCHEYLETGVFNVWREKDRNELIAIRNGRWSLDKVKEEAQKWFALCDEAFKKTEQPMKPDWEYANKLITVIMKRELGCE